MTEQHAQNHKRLLFSLHGIYTDGPWQEGTAAVLSPFYRYTPIKYGEFRHGAVTKLALDLLLSLAFLILAIFLWQFRLITGYILWFSYLLVALLAVFIGNRVAHRLRSKAINEVYTAMVDKVVNDESPHLIAHSLGTYVGAKLLQKYQDFRYESVILTGSVLRRRFPWQDMRSRFAFVTNEAGRHDLVPYAATLLSLFVSDMGCSGSRGFKNPLFVHTISPEDIHPHCFMAKNCPCDAHSYHELCNRKIHNIIYDHLQHRDYFVGLMHAWYSWLPVLWNIDPVLYRDFQELCFKCERNPSGVYSDEDDPFIRLKRGCWGWTKGRLDEYVKKHFVGRIRDRNKTLNGSGVTPLNVTDEDLERAVDLATMVMAENVGDAGNESRKRDNRDESVMRQLEPRKALNNAIDAVGEQLHWFEGS